MPIFQAIGLGLLIIILKLLVPPVFTQMENTTLSFLHGAQVSADAATSLASRVSSDSLLAGVASPTLAH